MEMTPTTVAIMIAVPLIALRLYFRVRRLIGRQRSRLWRHWTAAILFPLLLCLFGLSAMASPLALGGLALGIAVGIGLAIWGLRLTVFEKTDAGHFYTPNAHIGIALSLLLVGRIGYRFYQLSMLGVTDPQMGWQHIGRSPATTIIFGMLAGYYTWYAIGILRWRNSVRQVAEVKPV
ncbi:MAG: hypothetical protein HY255_12800 [Betaproteobacteria bacterium]|nr:hypothetical protein [Betaproteobacteria bacterium]